MKPGQIVRLIPLSPGWIAASLDDANFPAVNLANPQPKVVYRIAANASGAARSYEIDIDLQIDTPIDTLGLVSHNMDAVYMPWTAWATTSAVGTASIRDAGNSLFNDVPMVVAALTSPGRRYSAIQTFATVARRYIKVSITAPAGAPAFTIGVFAVGQTIALNPLFNFDLGSGRKIVDLSDVRQLPGGENGIWRKGRVATFRATWAQLTDAELRSVWSLVSEIGLSAPLLLIEDPDTTPGFQERVHYGLLDALDFYTRQQVDKSSIELKVREWL